MSQYATALDFTKTYEESFSLFGDALSQVEKEAEYVQFIKDNARYIIHTLSLTLLFSQRVLTIISLLSVVWGVFIFSILCKGLLVGWLIRHYNAVW